MANQENKQIFNPNQPVFVGLDVHKTKWSVSIFHCDEEIGHFTIPGEFNALKKLLQRYEGLKIYSVYEAGCLGFHLHFSLTEFGSENIIVSPNKIPTIVGDLVKTDRRDAKKLAFSLSKGLLKGIYIPSRDEIDKRQILQTREQLKQKRIRAINQLKMLLLQFDIKLTRGLSEEKRQEILQLNLP